MTGFHWIVKDELAGSAQPGLYSDWDKDVAYMKKRGIDYIMSLTERPLIEEDATDEGFHFYHFPIRDMDSPMPRNAFQAIEFMSEEIKKGHKFLIHCKGGVGRTGLMGACYWITKGLTAEEAITKVRTVHQPYIQTRGQESFIGHFEDFYKKNHVDVGH
ncbi:MAG: hypothetical protein CMB80_32880 [Flammeovirgaceae bacterium]|nr:hypothetical protein [Flammeovirgaceae bacterium]MBE62165.1 hypothetical protein [Flammeovirgaceae bacterium]MBR10613.1 hypothetical protein [Rickettsiales bacterium]HCX21172.1 hypothetical protein [Cytophagales bacterium]|tara:strand:- start:14 stop:490 length:477 start_codon:yes stop_codon:yes gene_type:complete